MAELPPQSPPIPFKMKAPRSHDLTLNRGQPPQISGRLGKDIPDHHNSNSVNFNKNNSDLDETTMDDMNSSYYILEPHPDFSDYSPTKSEDRGSPTIEQTPQSLSVTITSSSPCKVAAASASPMSSPLLSDSVDYRRRLGQTYHRQFSHNQHPQHHYVQEQQQHHHHRQYARSKSEDTGQGYYSVEDTIKVGACTVLSWRACDRSKDKTKGLYTIQNKHTQTLVQLVYNQENRSKQTHEKHNTRL
ncbi:hypothetical protein RRG08_021137 [Elysia crispata]|uniref:Uncharacterized protein n=1 Tax=Elysia crispata TaxID=231223 RepID=A0AAE0Z5R8_9GAST|nr:hypothetical protein RRG08_021137 [Elysia crispata]